MPERSKGPDKERHPGPPGWGLGMGPKPHPVKRMLFRNLTTRLGQMEYIGNGQSKDMTP
jgi:hypothetical protein